MSIQARPGPQVSHSLPNLSCLERQVEEEEVGPIFLPSLDQNFGTNLCHGNGHLAGCQWSPLELEPLGLAANETSLDIIRANTSSTSNTSSTLDQIDRRILLIGAFLFSLAIKCLVHLLPTLAQPVDLTSQLMLALNTSAALTALMMASIPTFNKSMVGLSCHKVMVALAGVASTTFLSLHLALWPLPAALTPLYASFGLFLAAIRIGQTRWIMKLGGSDHATLVGKFLTVTQGLVFVIIGLSLYITSGTGEKEDEDEERSRPSNEEAALTTINFSSKEWQTLIATGIIFSVCFLSLHILTFVLIPKSMMARDSCFAIQNDNNINNSCGLPGRGSSRPLAKTIFKLFKRGWHPHCHGHGFVALKATADRGGGGGFKSIPGPDLSLVLPMVAFIGLEEAFMVRHFLKDYVLDVLGFASLGPVILVFGLARGLSSWLAGQFTTKVGPRTAVVAAATIMQSGILLILHTWSPSPLDPALFLALAFIFGTTLALLSFATLDAIVESSEGSSSALVAFHHHFGLSVVFLLDLLDMSPGKVKLLMSVSFVLASVPMVVSEVVKSKQRTTNPSTRLSNTT